MPRTTRPYAPTAEHDEVRERLQRYRERRMAEIRMATEAPKQGFVSLEELRAFVAGETPWPERPR